MTYKRTSCSFSDLLRRLSRAQQTVFCGRILLFLAKFFPVTERSGGFLLYTMETSLLHPSNCRSQRGVRVQSRQQHCVQREDGRRGRGQGQGRDRGGPNEVSRRHRHRFAKCNHTPQNFSLNIDYALYKKFWTLQDFFRNPQQCYEKIRWKTFATVKK